MASPRKTIAGAAVSLVAVLLVLGLWLAGTGDGKEPAAGVRGASGAQTPLAESGGSDCGPPSICTAEAAATRAAEWEYRPAADWIARRMTMATAVDIVGGWNTEPEDLVVWLVASRGSDPADPGVLVLINASTGDPFLSQDLAIPGEPIIQFAELEAMEDDAGLLVRPPGPDPTMTPMESCGPFVLCTPEGVLADANAFMPEMIDQLEGGDVDFDRAAARLVPWGVIESELMQQEDGASEGMLWCNDPRPDQLVWVAALPVPITTTDKAATGLLLFFTPAEAFFAIGSGTLAADPALGLSLDEVSSWTSRPMPADLDGAAPGLANCH